MTINKVFITDPAERGLVHQLVRLNVEVDSYPTVHAVDHVDDWRVATRGPFIEYENTDGHVYPVGEFNTTQATEEPLFPVTVHVGTESMIVHAFMRVSRVRSLMRQQHDLGPWTLVLSNWAAMHGDIEWHLERTDSECLYCKRDGLVQATKATQKIYPVPGRAVLVCDHHARGHNGKFAASRLG
jgi:hypothetical protein